MFNLNFNHRFNQTYINIKSTSIKNIFYKIYFKKIITTKIIIISNRLLNAHSSRLKSAAAKKWEITGKRDGVEEESNNSHRLRFRHIILAFSLQNSDQLKRYVMGFSLLFLTAGVSDLYGVWIPHTNYKI